MYHEGELFFQTAMWSGSLNDFLLSRTGYANATLAPIYRDHAVSAGRRRARCGQVRFLPAAGQSDRHADAGRVSQ